MVRALFAVARHMQPSIVFIDEIDSLLSSRSEKEHEASRRLKTEFLVQFDGVCTDKMEKLVIMGATNRPQELDEAARRRMVKRVYVSLPERENRIKIILELLNGQNYDLSQENLEWLADETEHYSASDITALCTDAALGPIREMNFTELAEVSARTIRPISMQDFQTSLRAIRPSVSPESLLEYEAWNQIFGCVSI